MDSRNWDLFDNLVEVLGGEKLAEDFAEYVLYCVEAEDFPPEAYSCENLCKSCKYFELFRENCPCALNITCIGYDDKGNHIVAACGSYEKTK